MERALLSIKVSFEHNTFSRVFLSIFSFVMLQLNVRLKLFASVTNDKHLSSKKDWYKSFSSLKQPEINLSFSCLDFGTSDFEHISGSNLCLRVFNFKRVKIGKLSLHFAQRKEPLRLYHSLFRCGCLDKPVTFFSSNHKIERVHLLLNWWSLLNICQSNEREISLDYKFKHML